MEPSTVIPFRWDVARPESLGSLAVGDAAPAYHEFPDDLRTCCAGVWGAAGGCDLFFVGRSPESIYDYLRGACAGTPWAGRLHRLNVSLRNADGHAGRACRLAALRAYLASLGLHPADLARTPRPVAVVDLVFSGGTFCQLIRVLYGWCVRERGDWPAVCRKLRFIGVVQRHTGRWRPYRWERQHHRVVALVGGRAAVRNVVVPARLWEYLGDQQPHVAKSYTATMWGNAVALRAPREAGHLLALRQAVRIHRRAQKRPERLAFVGELARAGALRHRDVRRLVLALRGITRGTICEKYHGRETGGCATAVGISVGLDQLMTSARPTSNSPDGMRSGTVIQNEAP